MKWRIGLADDWQRLHTRGTVIYSGAVGALAPIGLALRDTWNGMPDDLKQYLPHDVKQAISYTVLCLTFIAIRYTTVRRAPTAGEPQ
ncbi:hypothetical protein GIY62_06360 [Burkholderia plantarii]|uniref:DUF7940 domain-containing protein n=1 Tax=Burkholderia plantarii TaxID=41899 RepID=UPI00272B1EFC|nr:hypothetical protein [Burkholderia plantarii]WLE60277.1 hypothetical protein GIY62_06360 [Burkholderia plantarii]